MNAGMVAAACLAVPTIGALLVAALRSRPNLREGATLLTAATLFYLVAGLLLPVVLRGERPRLVLGEPLPGIPLVLEVEPLGVVFALVASFLWIVTSIYAIGYMRGHHEENQTRFYIFFAVAIAGVMGVAFAGNLLTLFVFYEALTLSTFPLVTHHGTDEAKKGGRIYLGVLLFTSVFLLLPGIIWTWELAGTLEFRAGGILPGTMSTTAVTLLLGLYVFGIGKAAVMPFHRWLPAAMVAPTPVSALLHAVAVVKAGVFAILKISVYVFGVDFLRELGASVAFAYIAAATILIASIVAFSKDNLKARLAYSTISQLSYIVLGAMLANSMGIVGGALHIVMHAFGKITLFFGAGAILVAAHRTRVSELDGLGRTMPVTMATFLIGTFSIVGLPLAGGMWSKWYLGLGALDAGQPLLLAALMLSSLLSIGYLLIIPVRAFFGTAPQPAHEPTHPLAYDRGPLAHAELLDEGAGVPKGQAKIQEAPLPMLVAMVTTAAITIVLFVYPDPFYRLVQMVVGQ